MIGSLGCGEALAAVGVAALVADAVGVTVCVAAGALVGGAAGAPEQPVARTSTAIGVRKRLVMPSIQAQHTTTRG